MEFSVYSVQAGWWLKFSCYSHPDDTALFKTHEELLQHKPQFLFTSIYSTLMWGCRATADNNSSIPACASQQKRLTDMLTLISRSPLPHFPQTAVLNLDYFVPPVWMKCWKNVHGWNWFCHAVFLPKHKVSKIVHSTSRALFIYHQKMNLKGILHFTKDLVKGHCVLTTQSHEGWFLGVIGIGKENIGASACLRLLEAIFSSGWKTMTRSGQFPAQQICVYSNSLPGHDANIALWRLDVEITVGRALIICLDLAYLLSYLNNPENPVQALLLFVQRMWRPSLFALFAMLQLTDCMEPEIR